MQVIPASRLTFDSVDDWTESLMWKNLVAALPGKVVIIFWLGQNDCDNFSKALGTRPEQSKIDYYKGKMTRMLDRKEAYFQEAVKHGKAKTYWISPSDEPGYDFTPQYIQMVSMLRNEIEGRKNHIKIPNMNHMTYEDDHYHVDPASRVKIATILAARIRELL